MSNLRYEIYSNWVLSLAKSIIVKHSDSARLVNEAIKSKAWYTGITVDENRPETWKYYMNLAGLYHETDTPIMITSLDTRELIPFTKEKLAFHRGTAREYAYGSSYYNELVAQYPNMRSLIRGIVNPVDIDLAINSKDYTILYFDEKLVEPQEYELMAELQEWIYRAADRWNIKDYKHTDDLYPLAVLGKLYSFISPAIHVIRLEKIHTFQAHSFFVWGYLASNGYLDKYKRELNLDQAMWLYRNIAWVQANAGKTETFEALMENMLTKRGLPLGAYDIVQNDRQMPIDLNPIGETIRTDLNPVDPKYRNVVSRGLDYVFEKELPDAKDNDSVMLADLAEMRTKSAMSPVSRVPTKVLESDVIDTTNSEPYKLEQVLFNHWIHLTYTGDYISSINVKNPYTTELMTMTVRDALLTWIYVANKSIGITLTEIPRLKARSVIRRPLPRYADLRPLADPKHVPDWKIDRLLDSLVSVGLIISTETFNEIITEVHATMLEHRLMWAVEDELPVRAEMESMIMRAYQTVAYDFYPPGTLYSDYFRTKGFDVEELVAEDCQILMVDIWNLALGMDITQKVLLKDVQRAMIAIMSQLDTYDVQYIRSINENSAYALDPQPVRITKPPIETFARLPSYDYGIDFVKFGVGLNDYIDLTEQTVLDTTVVKSVPHTKVEVELPNVFEGGIRQEFYISAALSNIRVKFPNSGNSDDLIFDGNLGDIIITPMEGKDLAKVISNTDLDGLFIEE